MSIECQNQNEVWFRLCAYCIEVESCILQINCFVLILRIFLKSACQISAGSKLATNLSNCLLGPCDLHAPSLISNHKCYYFYRIE